MFHNPIGNTMIQEECLSMNLGENERWAIGQNGLSSEEEACK
jgi:hypothetical protein